MKSFGLKFVDENVSSTIEIIEVVEVIVEVMGVVEVIEVSLLSVEVTSLQKSKSLRVVPHSFFNPSFQTLPEAQRTQGIESKT